MKRRVDRCLLLLLGMLCAGSLLRAEAPAKGPYQDVLGNMMQAIVANDRATFVGSATNQFRNAMSEKPWKSLVGNMQAPLKGGYTLTYFGKLSQQGIDIFVYKLSFANGRDDVLVKLVMSNDFVAGLWFQ